MLLLSGWACQPPDPPRTELAFYHWQTDLQIDSLATTYWETTQAQRLYVKFFDVDWDFNQQTAVPQAQLQRHYWPKNADIVPTIFITNRTFREIAPADIPALAKRCWTKITELWPRTTFTEVQLDCDWSATTRERFFKFLDVLQSYLPPETTLSATIRLHQYRYPEQTGVPPVDRGMLMFYNMGEVNDWAEPNSILNLETAAPYLQTSAYPLPLDIALPLFRWSVLFRQGKMIKLLNGLDEATLQARQFVPDTVAGVRYYRVAHAQYWQAYYLYENDYLRPEEPTEATLLAATQQLRQLPVPAGVRYLSFYHLDSVALAAYDPTLLQRCQQHLTHED
ncbi:MAG: hypothetical protein AAGJ82_07620 [Bacteroidota bacterium]